MTKIDDYTAFIESRKQIEMAERREELLRRPNLLDGIELPTVRDIDEAEFICHEFESVLTAGPEAGEVQWGHKNHRVWTFHDTVSMLTGPGYRQIEEMINWAVDQKDLLVHCHAGMSRSTASAWGVAIARGADPLDSLLALQQAHPREWRGDRRLFIPNSLIVTYLERILGDGNLLEIRERVLMADPSVSYLL